MTEAQETVIGLKLLRADGMSLNSRYGRVFYPVGEWITVPGNGAYVAVSGGLHMGGWGPLLVALECDEETELHASPSGVRCFTRVRRLEKMPRGYKFPGDLDLSGLTSAEAVGIQAKAAGRKLAPMP